MYNLKKNISIEDVKKHGSEFFALSGFILAVLLDCSRELEKLFDKSKLTAENWIWLLIRDQYYWVEKCPFEKFDAKNWGDLISEAPELANNINWKKFEGGERMQIIERAKKGLDKGYYAALYKAAFPEKQKQPVTEGSYHRYTIEELRIDLMRQIYDISTDWYNRDWAVKLLNFIKDYKDLQALYRDLKKSDEGQHNCYFFLKLDYEQFVVAYDFVKPAFEIDLRNLLNEHPKYQKYCGREPLDKERKYPINTLAELKKDIDINRKAAISCESRAQLEILHKFLEPIQSLEKLYIELRRDEKDCDLYLRIHGYLQFTNYPKYAKLGFFHFSNGDELVSHLKIVPTDIKMYNIGLLNASHWKSLLEKHPYLIRYSPYHFSKDQITGEKTIKHHCMCHCICNL